MDRRCRLQLFSLAFSNLWSLRVTLVEPRSVRVCSAIFKLLWRRGHSVKASGIVPMYTFLGPGGLEYPFCGRHPAHFETIPISIGMYKFASLIRGALGFEVFWFGFMRITSTGSASRCLGLLCHSWHGCSVLADLPYVRLSAG